MEYTTVYQVCIAVSIVILSLAVAVIAIVRAVTSSRKGNPSFMAGLKDLKKINNAGLTGRSIPISREEFKACREKESINALVPEIEEATKKCKHPSYREALLVEQLNTRSLIASNELNNVSTMVVEFQNAKSQAKKDAIIDRFNAAKENYLNGFESAAYWHLQGLISFPVYKENYLRCTLELRESIGVADNFTSIAEIEKKYKDYYKEETKPEEE